MAEDDGSSMRLMRRIVDNIGFKYKTAADGRQAIHLIDTHSFDVILTDIMMPYHSGMELLELSIDLDPTVQVIMITAHASMDTAVEALNSGAFRYFVKPIVEIDGLEASIRQAMEYRRLLQENARLVARERERSDALEDRVGGQVVKNRQLDQSFRQILDYLPVAVYTTEEKRGWKPRNSQGEALIVYDSKDGYETVETPPVMRLLGEVELEAQGPSEVDLMGAPYQLDVARLATKAGALTWMATLQPLGRSPAGSIDQITQPLARMSEGVSKLMLVIDHQDQEQIIVDVIRQIRALREIWNGETRAAGAT